MNLIKLSIIVFVLLVRPCRTKLTIPERNVRITPSQIVTELGNIVASCYPDKIKGVGLAGNLPITLPRILNVQHLIPVAMINHKMDVSNMPRHLTNDFRYKLHIFILQGYATKTLSNLITKILKSSVWWNHMASFFILDLSSGCVHAKDFLLVAWKNDMLNAKVMCNSRKGGKITIFDYNPFTSQAPLSWQRVKVFPGKNNHSFTLLRQTYQEHKRICANLNFDKTKQFGGYRILVEGRKWTERQISPDEVNNEHEEFHNVRRNILRNVYRALNLNARYNGEERQWQVITRTDMIAFTLRVNNPVHKKMSYLTGPVGNNIVTQVRRNREPRRFNESFTICDNGTRLVTPVLYLVTLLVFKFFVDQALVPLLLNLIRMTCKTSFIDLRNINSMRVYLINVSFFVVMMQAIFYANLTYPLTKQIPLRNVETVEDLVDFGYTQVMGSDEDQDYYESLGPKSVFEIGALDKCIKRLTNSPSLACMNDLYAVRDQIEKLNLHVSNQFHEPCYEAFPIRSNWPIEERFNAMLARSFEASVHEPWYLKFNLITLRIFRKSETDRSNRNVESIKLREVTFAFIFLLIGHVFATVILVIELASPYRCSCRIWIVRRY